MPSASPADVLAAADATDRTAAGWAATASRRRAEILLKAYELMIERADLIVAENGKVRADARGEVIYAAESFHFDDAVEGAMLAKMRKGGESCAAANRFFVQRGIAPAFTERFADAMSQL